MPTGIFTVDTKGDREDVPHVTEINARPTNTWLLTQAGVNFADLLVRVALGDQVDPVPPRSYTRELMVIRKVDFPPCFVEPNAVLKATDRSA